MSPTNFPPPLSKKINSKTNNKKFFFVSTKLVPMNDVLLLPRACRPFLLFLFVVDLSSIAVFLPTSSNMPSAKALPSCVFRSSKKLSSNVVVFRPAPPSMFVRRSEDRVGVRLPPPPADMKKFVFIFCLPSLINPEKRKERRRGGRERRRKKRGGREEEEKNNQNPHKITWIHISKKIKLKQG